MVRAAMSTPESLAGLHTPTTRTDVFTALFIAFG